MSFTNLLNGFRAKRELGPLNEVMKNLQVSLSDPNNIKKWKEGIEKFNPETGSDAYSHYAGFSRNVIGDAANAASRLSFDGDARFAANDLEQVLEPSRVATFLKTIPDDMPHLQIHGEVAKFISTSLSEAIEARKELTSGAPIPVQQARTLGM